MSSSMESSLFPFFGESFFSLCFDGGGDDFLGGESFSSSCIAFLRLIALALFGFITMGGPS